MRIKGLLEEITELKEKEVMLLFKNRNGHVVIELRDKAHKSYRVIKLDERCDVGNFSYSYTTGLTETLARALEMAQELCND